MNLFRSRARDEIHFESALELVNAGLESPVSRQTGMPALRERSSALAADAATGYLHRLYAESLAEFGEARELAAAGGWILQRPTPVLNLKDAMGCYPLFCCRDWQRRSLRAYRPMD